MTPWQTTPYPVYASPSPVAGPLPAAPPPAVAQWKRLNELAGNSGLFDAFEINRTQPNIETSGLTSLRQQLFRPMESARLGNQLAASGETFAQRVVMLRAIRESLKGDGRQQLDALLQNGRLCDVRSENGHSTLYQLYAILTTPRQQGFKNRHILRETLAILASPQAITQKITPLTADSADELLKLHNQEPLLNRERVFPAQGPITRRDVEVEFSNACVPSSVMFYMADKNPSEFARQINELTSPMSAFLRTVPLSAISPQNPSQAYRILDENYVTYYKTAPDRVTVRVSLPPEGVARAVNDSQRERHFKTRSGVETAYQSALAFVSTQRTYDAALDQSADYAGGPMLQGLNAAQKDLMETLIKGGGGVKSVNLMITAASQTPRSPQDVGQPFLYGYTRSFEQTQRDIMQALDMGEYVIIGFVPVSAGGMILPGHEITLAGYEQDAKTGDVRFIVFDSDDNNPQKVVKAARDLIPRIHHAGMPMAIARRIEAEMKQSPGYFRPNAEDGARFKPVSVSNDPLPPDAMTQILPQDAPSFSPFAPGSPVMPPWAAATPSLAWPSA